MKINVSGVLNLKYNNFIATGSDIRTKGIAAIIAVGENAAKFLEFFNITHLYADNVDDIVEVLDCADFAGLKDVLIVFNEDEIDENIEDSLYKYVDTLEEANSSLCAVPSVEKMILESEMFRFHIKAPDKASANEWYKSKLVSACNMTPFEYNDTCLTKCLTDDCCFCEVPCPWYVKGNKTKILSGIHYETFYRLGVIRRVSAEIKECMVKAISVVDSNLETISYENSMRLAMAIIMGNFKFNNEELFEEALTYADNILNAGAHDHECDDECDCDDCEQEDSYDEIPEVVEEIPTIEVSEIEDAPVEEEVPTVEETAVAEEAANEFLTDIEEAPVVESEEVQKTPEVEESSAAEEAPVVEEVQEAPEVEEVQEVPVVEEVQEAPVIEEILEAPSVEEVLEAPAVEEVPEAPMVEEPTIEVEEPTIEVEETPIEETPVGEVPTVKEAPVAEETPVEEVPVEEVPVVEEAANELESEDNIIIAEPFDDITESEVSCNTEGEEIVEEYKDGGPSEGMAETDSEENHSSEGILPEIPAEPVSEYNHGLREDSEVQVADEGEVLYSENIPEDMTREEYESLSDEEKELLREYLEADENTYVAEENYNETSSEYDEAIVDIDLDSLSEEERALVIEYLENN